MVIIILIWGDFYFLDINCKIFYDIVDFDNIIRYSKFGFMNING